MRLSWLLVALVGDSWCGILAGIFKPLSMHDLFLRLISFSLSGVFALGLCCPIGYYNIELKLRFISILSK